MYMQHMPPEMLEKIIKELKQNRNLLSTIRDLSSVAISSKSLHQKAQPVLNEIGSQLFRPPLKDLASVRSINVAFFPDDDGLSAGNYRRGRQPRPGRRAMQISLHNDRTYMLNINPKTSNVLKRGIGLSTLSTEKDFLDVNKYLKNPQILGEVARAVRATQVAQHTTEYTPVLIESTLYQFKIRDGNILEISDENDHDFFLFATFVKNGLNCVKIEVDSDTHTPIEFELVLEEHSDGWKVRDLNLMNPINFQMLDVSDILGSVPPDVDLISSKKLIDAVKRIQP